VVQVTQLQIAVISFT